MTRPRAKLFYPPGSISIILLPILCIWNLHLKGHLDKIGAMDVGYFSHESVGEYFGNNSFEKIKLTRNFSEIELSGNQFKDNAKINNARIKVATMVSSKDTINGVLFKFTDKTKYKDFVGALDLSQQKEANSVINGDNIWIYYAKPVEVKLKDYFFCGTNDISREIEMNSEKAETFQKYIHEKFSSFVLLSIVFLLICFFAFRK